MKPYKGSMSLLADWSRYRVRTLDATALRQDALALATQAEGFAPQMLIGIRSGGYVVAEIMAARFPDARLLPITNRRPGTTAKQSSGMKTLLKRLPYAINDRLRIAEHLYLTQLRAPKPRSFTPDTAELAAIGHALREQPEARILLIDDAVDSGATLLGVRDSIQALASTAIVRSAALTVTTHAPLIQPDFFLHRYVLCRFPWSFDFAA